MKRKESEKEEKSEKEEQQMLKRRLVRQQAPTSRKGSTNKSKFENGFTDFDMIAASGFCEVYAEWVCLKARR